MFWLGENVTQIYQWVFFIIQNSDGMRMNLCVYRMLMLFMAFYGLRCLKVECLPVTSYVLIYLGRNNKFKQD